MAIPQLKLAKYLDAYGPDSVVALGSFTTAGTSAPTVVEAQGFSVARTGVGVYTLTFARGWKAITLTASVQGTTAALIPTFGVPDPVTRTVTLTMRATATATESTGTTVHVQAILRKSV